VIHPIEAESYRILAERVDLDRWPPLARAVVARVIHASADPGYADTLVVDEAACAAGLAALDAGASVVADVEMVAVATRRAGTCCLLVEGRAMQARMQDAEPRLTASAAAMRVAAERFPTGAVVVVGNAPTALFEVVRLVRAGRFAPALVIGLPVGFVGAADAKAALRACAVPSISNVGERGGSAVAAAALNALLRLRHTGAREADAVVHPGPGPRHARPGEAADGGQPEPERRRASAGEAGNEVQPEPGSPQPEPEPGSPAPERGSR